jgi:hypothetical protein
MKSLIKEHSEFGNNFMTHIGGPKLIVTDVIMLKNQSFVVFMQ